MLRVLRWIRPGAGSRTPSVEHVRPTSVPFPTERTKDIEALVSVSRDPAGGSTLQDPALCQTVTRLLDAAGCGVLLRDPVSETFRLVSAFGEWGGENLAELLRTEGAAWGFAFSQGVAFARRSGGHAEPITAMASGEAEASCAAVPLMYDGVRIGGLIVGYAEESTFPARSLPLIRFLAEFVALHAVAEHAKAERHRQAEQINRLTSDVERMAILLRGLKASKG